jgi:hypothetical protein
MRDVREGLERLGEEGTPRGADAVMRGARVSLRRRPGRERTRPGRDRRPASALVTVVVVVVAVIAAGALVTLADDDPSDEPTKVAAPSVVVGDADAVVLSSNLDADLARAQIDPAVLEVVRGVDGVTGAQGAIRRFVQVGGPDGGQRVEADEASERSTIAVQAEGTTFETIDGRMPEAAGEIAINSVLAARFHAGPGGELPVGAGPLYSPGPATCEGQILESGREPDGSAWKSIACKPASARIEPPTMRVVGVFSLPGGDVEDVNLLAMTGEELQSLTTGTGYDRIDVTVRDGEPLEDVLDRIGAALPGGLIVVPTSALTADDQLRSELDIQRAYFWLVNTDPEKRSRAHEARPDDQDPATSESTYEERKSEAVNVEMRVSRIAFVDLDTAIVSYRVYYSGTPSPIANVPLTALVVRRDGRWVISSQGICQLSVYTDNPCDAPVGPDDFVLAPDGWASPSTQTEAVDALRVLADPSSTVDARVAAVEDGDAVREQVESGANADAARGGGVSLNVLGARVLAPGRVQVLYSLVADGEPRIETPYPVTATAVLVDGTWKVLRRYACGLTALAGQPCALPAAAVTTTTTTPPATTTSSAAASAPTTVRPTTTTVAAPPTTEPAASTAPTNATSP